MLHALFAVLGLLEVLWPRRVVDFWMNLAADGDAELRPWVYTAARVEGVVILLWLLSRRKAASRSE